MFPQLSEDLHEETGRLILPDWQHLGQSTLAGDDFAGVCGSNIFTTGGNVVQSSSRPSGCVALLSDAGEATEISSGERNL